MQGLVVIIVLLTGVNGVAVGDAQCHGDDVCAMIQQCDMICAVTQLLIVDHRVK